MRKRKLVVCGCLCLAVILTGLTFAQGARKGGGGLAPPGTLNDAEKAGLLQMREEEKLAHDVYLKMYEKYQKTIFSNIMVSEQRHMDAVKGLLDRYGLDDPAKGNGVGVFESDFLQALYNQLITAGMVSAVEAFKVGVRIEELDIADLTALRSETDKPDIQTVYTNLLNGSYNHLDAFTYHLQRFGY